MTLGETVVWEGRRLGLRWLEPPFRPPMAQTTQAAGLCFDEAGRIVLVSQDGLSWGLPGGKPEPGESAEGALVREAWEEAGAEVLALAYLGCQEVSDPARPAPHYQARFWARVRLGPFAAAHETAHRCLVHPDDFLNALSWGHSPVARLLLARALEIA